MVRPRLAPVLGFVLVALVALGATSSAWAHGVTAVARFLDLSASSDELSSAAETHDEDLSSSLPATTPAPPTVPWPVLLAGLVSVAFGLHLRRRGPALALVLLLVSFAFEVGLHSVHHGADSGQIASCAAAAASAHLAATLVDGAISVEAILPAVAAAPAFNLSRPVTSSLRPDQGRAPPA